MIDLRENLERSLKMFQEKIMKNKIYRFVIFQLLLFGLFKICHAYVGIGISDVGTLGSSTGIEIDNITPDGYRLYQNYPNPFNPVTTITFSIEQTGIVSLKIYNTIGNEVAELLYKKLKPGHYSYKWNARGLASGTYFYRIKSGDFVATKKMVVLR